MKIFYNILDQKIFIDITVYKVTLSVSNILELSQGHKLKRIDSTFIWLKIERMVQLFPFHLLFTNLLINCEPKCL